MIQSKCLALCFLIGGESKILRAPLAFERQDLLDNSKWSTMTMVFMDIAVYDQTHVWI